MSIAAHTQKTCRWSVSQVFGEQIQGLASTCGKQSACSRRCDVGSDFRRQRQARLLLPIDSTKTNLLRRSVLLARRIHDMSTRALRSAAFRHYPVGAEVTNEGVAFRVWAPSCKRVGVSIGEQHTPDIFELRAEGNGYFAGTRADTAPGTLYGFRLDDESRIYPDPVSRFQPRGHDGRSQIIDSRSFAWSDAGWRGVGRTGQVLYEMHIGTFTAEGTWSAAARALPWLAKLGVTVLELMPVGEFPGRAGATVPPHR